MDGLSKAHRSNLDKTEQAIRPFVANIIRQDLGVIERTWPRERRPGDSSETNGLHRLASTQDGALGIVRACVGEGGPEPMTARTEAVGDGEVPCSLATMLVRCWFGAALDRANRGSPRTRGCLAVPRHCGLGPGAHQWPSRCMFGRSVQRAGCFQVEETRQGNANHVVGGDAGSREGAKCMQGWQGRLTRQFGAWLGAAMLCSKGRLASFPGHLLRAT